MIAADEEFLAGLPVFRHFEDVADPALYRALPPGWGLAIADIVDSTAAIGTGRYKAVNMAGAAVISSVSNSLGRHDLPFVFGGDGAAVAVPPHGLPVARTALSNVQRWVKDDLDLAMRVALIPVEDIRSNGFDIRVARFQASEDVSYAMFSGGGNSWAEARMKEGQYALPAAEAGERPDLTGLSCRWNPIPATRGKVVSIIAVPGPSRDMPAFRQLVIDLVDLAEQDARHGHPVPEDGPKLGFVGEGLGLEARAGAAYHDVWGKMRRSFRILGESLLVNLLSVTGLSFGPFNAVRYRRSVASNTDFRKFDDGLKMTVDIDASRLEKIRTRLEQGRLSGSCYYGLHEQDAALMTCIVPSPLSRDHMHFVDGADGGYAAAASRLKQQIQSAATG
ncbi:DUF3095 domain-containing protein [Agrobacterium tumefaciens]|jgi:hypothetical protein|uniref:DUF3095 domain-containing protein n=1 Tax=Agrobacterium tumefaciens TaxID=358 RepID=A0AAP9E3W5_AGRTU|nr:DUF3095 domain-containing protein [Agrobacterium tumefaciens]MCW8059783.1 DUF3095 domain-containing protein [Agrobacterium tumefaciens]MCW8143916.1 DUF3095 domain-containing protein [Agrobacterium tumefaciens]MQB37929.1 DUF3095 domain-containing protein [Agrobacterium tumefaciens]NSZ58327.1 DUF3095 domain-containing protein [Agrobacterium tumefaciens]QDY94420.1 DUF3095 domain-containing protein [Agrobacterium tumefaciens]